VGGAGPARRRALPDGLQPDGLSSRLTKVNPLGSRIRKSSNHLRSTKGMRLCAA
jgi:hypothetical protein